MTKKQSAAMQVLRAVGKQGASVLCVAEATKIKPNDVSRIFKILSNNNMLIVENDVAHLTPKFLKEVPLWKEMKSALITINELM